MIENKNKNDDKKQYFIENDREKETAQLSEQVQSFLDSGGAIQKIPSGVSGQVRISFRHSMTISSKDSQRFKKKNS